MKTMNTAADYINTALDNAQDYLGNGESVMFSLSVVEAAINTAFGPDSVQRAHTWGEDGIITFNGCPFIIVDADGDITIIKPNTDKHQTNLTKYDRHECPNMGLAVENTIMRHRFGF